MRIFFAFALTCISLCSRAQTRHSVFHFNDAITFNPSVLIATDNTAMLGVERQLPHHLSLALDAGYIFATYYIQNNTLKGTSGFTVRPALKYYNTSGKGFLQFQVSYKQVNYKLEDWLGKDCVNGTPAYEKFQAFTFRKKDLSFNAMAGELFRFSNTVFLELYGGLGAKLKHQQPTEASACYQNANGFTFNLLQEETTTINVPMGLKLIVAVR